MAITQKTVSPVRICETLHEELLGHLHRGDGPDAMAAALLRCESLPESVPGRASLLRCARLAVELSGEIRQHQQRERGLMMVSETATTLTQLRSLDDVLDGIVCRGRQLLGSHLAWLAGIDRAAGTTFVIAIDGVNTEPIRRMRVPLTTGIAGKVIQSGVPFSTSQYSGDERIVHDRRVDITLAGEGLQAGAGVPLLFDNHVIGVLIVGDRYARTYLPWEISILATLAAHAAVAVRNAEAFEATKAALHRAEEANLRLQQKTAAIELAAEAHEKFTLLVVKGGGTQELAMMVAEMLGGRVAVLDELGDMLCRASRLDKEESPKADEAARSDGDDPRIRSAMGESRVRGHSVEAFRTQERACRVAAAVGGTGAIGAMVIDTRAPLDEGAIRIFERSALVLALILLSQERRIASAREEAAYVTRGLLNPYVQAGHDLIERAARLGVDPRQPVVLAALETGDARPGHVCRRLGEVHRSPPMLIAEIDGLLVALVSSDDAVDVRDQLRQVFSARLRLPVLGAVAKPVTGGDTLADVYHRVKRCVGLLRSLGRNDAIAMESEFAMYAIAFEKCGADDVVLFLKATIGAVLDHDMRRGSSLAETLLAYMDHGYSAKAAAASLGVHVNTLMNRLDNVKALLGDWQALGLGAEIHLALRMWKLRESSAAAGN